MKLFKLITSTILIFVSFLLLARAAENYTVNGLVVDSESGKPIPGVSVRVVNSNAGSYSSSKGKFKVPFLKGENELKFKSLGYQSLTIKVNENKKDSLVVKLTPSPIELGNVQVTEKITANQIVERAIARKKDNLEKLKTFSGTLYSKMALEFDGNIFGSANQSEGTLSLSGTLGTKVDNKYQMFLLETFSKMYKDYEKDVTHTEIIQRKQTSNLKPDNNILAIGNFINFYDESIVLLNAEIVTPLSKKAFSYYDFSLLERKKLDDRYVYVLSVKPSSSVFPAFEGTMKIVEGTYNLIEVDFKPSKSTAITFVQDLHFNQKFEELKKDIWHPTFLEVSGKVNIEVVKGLVEVSANANATSIYSEAVINEPLPDSIYRKDIKRVTVSKHADSSKTEFWEKNALRDITEKEKSMYQKVDSLVKIDTIVKSIKNSSWSYDYQPVAEFNRVESLSLGLAPYISLFNTKLGGEAKYSIGLRRPLGTLYLSLPSIRISNLFLNFMVNTFSDVSITGYDNTYPIIINSLFTAIFHEDYYDYYRKDGWSANLFSNIFGGSLHVGFENSRQSHLTNTTNRSIFIKRDLRKNPEIIDGNYWTLKTGFEIGSYSDFSFGNNVEAKLQVMYLYGNNITKNVKFNLAESFLYLSFPTFSTGYNAMRLSLCLHGAMGERNLPVQYQFRMLNRYILLHSFGNFISSPVGIYGGTEGFDAHAKFNLTDIWMRAFGLTLYQGRGLDLVLAGSSGKYNNLNNVGYLSTKNDYYNELGFGLSRIPTYLSNVVFLSFDARWGIGPIAHDRFGWSVSISLPF